MGGFQTYISKCSRRAVKLNFLIFFFIGASTNKKVARSRIFRYGWVLQDNFNQKAKSKGGRRVHGLRG